MDVAVVGATGFVGRHVVAHLLEAGHAVRALSRGGERLAGLARDQRVRTLAVDIETGAGLTEPWMVRRRSFTWSPSPAGRGVGHSSGERCRRASALWMPPRRPVCVDRPPLGAGRRRRPRARLPAQQMAGRADRPRFGARVGRAATVAPLRGGGRFLRADPDHADLVVTRGGGHSRRRLRPLPAALGRRSGHGRGALPRGTRARPGAGVRAGGTRRT